MANEDQIAVLRQGVDVWNKWRKENPDVEIDLVEVNLSGADLRHVNFYQANLTMADLSKTNLDSANLREASLFRANLFAADLTEARLIVPNLNLANLTQAFLGGAEFVSAKLTGADFTEANFSGSQFEDCSLTNVRLSRAQMGGTNLISVDLSAALGLEEVEHHYQSYISIDTIYRSKGRLPRLFLQGIGLSDLDIEYAKLASPDLDPDQVTDITYKIHELYLGKGIRYYSSFISYCSQDEEFAKRLHNDLQGNGVRCWFAAEDMKIGDQIRLRIDQEIRLRDKLLVILSENSIKSEWVGDEVEAALEEENKSNRPLLFPIRLDDTVLNIRDGWAAKIKRSRHIGDFSNWQDKTRYQKAFERLLSDLKA
jgi:uncharacterized protein YjbI with pentapeptide repeats